MWPELAGGAAAWLAHVLWYLADSARARAMGLQERQTTPTRTAALQTLGVLLLVVSVGFWVAAHGAVLGACCALAALTAAASVNVIVAPLAPRALFTLAGTALAGLLLGIWEWSRGA